MSKIGKQKIELTDGVEVKVELGVVFVKGPKGELTFTLPRGIDLVASSKEVLVERKKDTKTLKALHGTTRSVVANMVKGVTDGWEKVLEMVGTGYRAEVRGDKLVLSVGYSHPVELTMPKGVSASVEKTEITIEGIDKELVGQTAAIIRSVRKPEPYKGKGIRYKDEVVRRKPGKAAKGPGVE